MKELKRFTVYDNKTDMPVIVSGTAHEAAKAMGIKYDSFWSLYSRFLKGMRIRWTFIDESKEVDD